MLVEIIFNQNIYSNDCYQPVNVLAYKYSHVIDKNLKILILELLEVI